MLLQFYCLFWCDILKLRSLGITNTIIAVFIQIYLFFLSLKVCFTVLSFFHFYSFILYFFLNFISFNFIIIIINFIWLRMQWDCNLDKAGVLSIVGVYAGAVIWTARWVLDSDIENNLRLTVKALFTSLIIFIIVDNIKVLLLYNMALLFLVIYSGFLNLTIIFVRCLK